MNEHSNTNGSGAQTKGAPRRRTRRLTSLARVFWGFYAWNLHRYRGTEFAPAASRPKVGRGRRRDGSEDDEGLAAAARVNDVGASNARSLASDSLIGAWRVNLGRGPRGCSVAARLMARHIPFRRRDEGPHLQRWCWVLRGRRGECETLDRLLEAACVRQSGALVVRGESGVGKTALLEYLVGRASGCRVARAAGVQSEMELAFAGLHQLCAPMLDRLDRLPGPERDALRTAFGLSDGEAPDCFSVGLAVLGLLSEVAESQPLVCVVDDAQWWDRASTQALAVVARRLLAESVAVVFAMRADSDEDELARLPELIVESLPDGDARALLGQRSKGRSTSGCVIGSWRRRAVTRWPCWNCRAA
jgi:AAA ATPase domain